MFLEYRGLWIVPEVLYQTMFNDDFRLAFFACHRFDVEGICQVCETYRCRQCRPVRGLDDDVDMLRHQAVGDEPYSSLVQVPVQVVQIIECFSLARKQAKFCVGFHNAYRDLIVPVFIKIGICIAAVPFKIFLSVHHTVSEVKTGLVIQNLGLQ